MQNKDLRVLVVDDMSTMRKIVTKAMGDLGYSKIDDAVDGDDAWKKIQTAHNDRKPYGLIISDWNMPKMKGIELLEKVRGNPQTAGTLFILLTAEAERDQVAIAIQGGVSGYLLKPFTTEQLGTALKNVFSKHPKAA